MSKNLNCPYVVCKCSVSAVPHFCLSTYFLIHKHFSVHLSLSVVVYPPSACPLLTEALVSLTLLILHRSSQLFTYTLYPCLLMRLSHTHLHTCKYQTLSPTRGPSYRWTCTPFVSCERGNQNQTLGQSLAWRNVIPLLSLKASNGLFLSKVLKTVLN